MRELQLKDVALDLSAVLDVVRRGEDVVITRNGQKEAVLITWAEWERLSKTPSFARLLMSSPLEATDIAPRDTAPLRKFDP